MGYFHKSEENINRHTATPPKKTMPTINVNNPRTKFDMLRPRSRSRSILSANAPPKQGRIIADWTKNGTTGKYLSSLSHNAYDALSNIVTETVTVPDDGAMRTSQIHKPALYSEGLSRSGDSQAGPA
jgi:hypothetical protein